MANTKPTDNRRPDWEAIARDYRAGLKSNMEIAREQTAQGRPVSEAAIRKRAKRDGWQRDLADDVRKEIRAQLQREAVRAEVRTPNAHEVVQHAAGEGVAIIKSHRKDIQQLRGLAARLTAKVETSLVEIESAADALRALGLNDDGEAAPDTLVDRLRAARVHADTISVVTAQLESLARTASRLVPLERQAYNLDEEQPGADEDFVARMKRARGRALSGEE